MSTAEEQQNSISALLRDADVLKEKLNNFPGSNSEEYQATLVAALEKYQKSKDAVARASMFSLNESLEDLATADMRCARPGWKLFKGIAPLLTRLQVLDHPLRYRGAQHEAAGVGPESSPAALAVALQGIRRHL